MTGLKLFGQVLFGFLCVLGYGIEHAAKRPVQSIIIGRTIQPTDPHSLLDYPMRGGAVKSPRNSPLRNPSGRDRRPLKSTKLNNPTWRNIWDSYTGIQPVTRGYLTVTIITAFIAWLYASVVKILSLDIERLYEVWRPFTAAMFLGKPSLPLANNIFFLVRYGQLLEDHNGSGNHIYFLVTQIGLLTFFSFILQFRFTAQSMIAAIIFLSSRINPMESMPFQFGLTITSWQLPFCMMIIDCLAQQSAAAAWPHILGILSGHIYHFLHDIWPRLGGKKYFLTPRWISSKFSRNSKFGTRKTNTR